MIASRRAWILVCAAALAVGGIAIALTATSNHEERPILQIALGLLVGWSFIASGLVASARRPDNRTGRLLLAVGFTWFLGAGSEANGAWPFTISSAVGGLFLAVFIHLVVSYPYGRLQTRLERAAVYVAYPTAILAGLLPLFFLRRPDSGCDECPRNTFYVAHHAGIGHAIQAVTSVIAVAVALAAMWILARRWRDATPASRRVLAPVLLTASTTVALLALGFAAGAISNHASTIVFDVALTAFVSVPIAVLAGLLRSRLARAEVGRLLVDVPQDRTLAETEGVLRRILHDPSLELAYWVPERGRYVDAEWRPRDLPEPSETRSVTPIHVDGAPVAALVHDAGLHSEQQLLTDTAAAMGLRLEQERRLHQLRASEQRMRALLDAIPDNMYRVDREGRYLDHSAAIPEDLVLPPEELNRSSIPEVLPGPIAEILMDGVRRALETGTIVTVEYRIQRSRGLRDVESRIVRSGEDEVVIIVRDITERKQAEAELDRLQSELRTRLAELQASRARIVEAGDAERRRLERNLHDGAQQRLVALSLSLRLARSRVRQDPDAADELLGGATTELAHALEELRELARGIHPAVLTERGLEPALETLVHRAPVPVEVESSLDGRLPPSVEAAAFYVVSEALANVAKYAEASSVEVRIGREDGYAVVEVADDGVGGADPSLGSGLRGLADRVEALQGRLEVDSRPGEGTRVRAEIPVA